MVRICMHIVKYNIKKWKQNYNILLGLIYLLIISDMMFRPARKIVEQLGFSPNISSFSLIWNSTFFILLFFLGVILFYSDAPFQDSMTSFVMIRCGKIKFMIAQICYIFFYYQLKQTDGENSGEQLHKLILQKKQNAAYNLIIIFFGNTNQKKLL